MVERLLAITGFAVDTRHMSGKRRKKKWRKVEKHKARFLQHISKRGVLTGDNPF